MILGDFNMCYASQKQRTVLKRLEELNFTQLVNNPTHIHGRIIDHVHFLSPNSSKSLYIKQHAQYFSDHDLIEIREIEGILTYIFL